jgi:hypothetical protein
VIAGGGGGGGGGEEEEEEEEDLGDGKWIWDLELGMLQVHWKQQEAS